MKYFYLILLGVFSCPLIKGQISYIDSTYNLYSGGEYARAIFPVDSNYVVFGSTMGANGALKLGMIKIDSVGNKIYQNAIPDSKYNWGFTFSPTNIIKDSLGGYFFASTCDTMVPSNPYYAGIVRLNNNGDTIFTKYLHDSLYDWTIDAVIQNADYTYTLAGAEYISSSSSKLLLIKIDTLGNVIWVKKYGTGSDIRHSWSICHATSGYIISGYKTVGATFYGYIVKTDLAGNVIWSLAPGALACGLPYVKKLKDGNYVACGYNAFYYNGSENFSKCYAIKFSDSGSIIWEKSYANQSPTTAFFDFIELQDSSLVFIGDQGISSSPYFWDAIILKTDKNGDSLWAHVYDRCGISSGEAFNSILQKDNGNFMAAGSFWFGCNPDYWVMELDSFGCNVSGCQTIGISELENEEKNNIVIYPNPCNANFQIQTSFYKYSIKLYNLTGEIVYENSDSPVQIDISTLPNGIYMTEFLFDNKTIRKKIIKI